MCVCVCVCSVTKLCLALVTPWIAARQASLSMGFSRQEYCNGSPFPPPGDLSDPGIKPASLASPALAARFFTPEPPEKHLFEEYSFSIRVSQSKSSTDNNN